MNLIKTDFDNLYIIENKIFNDNRGTFVKTFNEKIFIENNLNSNFKESFFSISNKDVIRGMHFQLPPEDHEKLVYVTSGEIIDVVVDLRKKSNTYGKYFSIELNEKNFKSIYIPKGFAHGFIVTSNSATVIYMTSTGHSPNYDCGIRWDSFGFNWNIEHPIISDRDKNFVLLKDFKSPF